MTLAARMALAARSEQNNSSEVTVELLSGKISVPSETALVRKFLELLNDRFGTQYTGAITQDDCRFIFYPNGNHQLKFTFSPSKPMPLGFQEFAQKLAQDCRKIQGEVNSRSLTLPQKAVRSIALAAATFGSLAAVLYTYFAKGGFEWIAQAVEPVVTPYALPVVFLGAAITVFYLALKQLPPAPDYVAALTEMRSSSSATPSTPGLSGSQPGAAPLPSFPPPSPSVASVSVGDSSGAGTTGSPTSGALLNNF